LASIKTFNIHGTSLRKMIFIEENGALNYENDLHTKKKKVILRSVL